MRKRIKAAGIMFNPIKCEFPRSLTFLGHLINYEGISQDSAKYISVIKDMPLP